MPVCSKLLLPKQHLHAVTYNVELAENPGNLVVAVSLSSLRTKEDHQRRFRWMMMMTLPGSGIMLVPAALRQSWLSLGLY